MSSIDGEPTNAINEVAFDKHLFETDGECIQLSVIELKKYFI